MKYGNQLSEAYGEMSQGDVFRQKAIPMRILKIIRSAFDATSIPSSVHWRTERHMESILTHIVVPLGMWYRFILPFGDTLWMQ